MNKLSIAVTKAVCAKPQMSYILTNVRVTLATSDVQSILEIPVTNEIHMEDRNHGLDYKDRFNRLVRQQLHKLDKIAEFH